MSESEELLLTLLFRNYDEEVARNELIDSKNSQMIVLTGTMLTLQATLFTTGLLNEFVYSHIPSSLKMWIFGLFIGSLITSVVSMILFMLAYKFVGTFKQAPTANYVEKSYIKKREYSAITDKLFKRLPKTIDKNKKIMKRKVKFANIGFVLIIINIVMILLFVSLLIYCFI
ncbi:MAG: hypothetical protein IJQ68_10400 [Methanobrevibacter sp.]|uniref:hypothetical protein n=1 Tax=Methanobrevibacter sp. TaxID=66852 RepID=UPI0025FE83EA|nr:hypothetical protein [Methanobrevibacter sp.]MBR0272377.1 hypothetical protein [Methanobrevibacter sp.]